MNFQVTTDLQSLNLNGGSGSKGKATLSPAERPGGDLKVSAESGNSEPEGDLKVSAAEPGVPRCTRWSAWEYKSLGKRGRS